MSAAPAVPALSPPLQPATPERAAGLWSNAWRRLGRNRAAVSADSSTGAGSGRPLSL